MNLQNNPGKKNLLFVDKKLGQKKKKKKLHAALEYISKLKKKKEKWGGSNRTGMKFDEHTLFLSLFPRPQHLKAAGAL